MSEDKTEEATPQKLREARRRGNLPKSAELTGGLTLLASFAALVATGEASMNGMIVLMRKNLQGLGHAQQAEITPGWYFLEVLYLMAESMIPILAAGIVMGVGAQVLMAGPVLVQEALKPKWERLNPLEKLKSWFSPRMLVELTKSLLKFGVLSWIGYRFLNEQMLPVVQTSLLTTGGLPAVGSLMTSFAWKVVLFMLILGVADAGYQLYDYRKQLRMTKYEVKQEHKNEEGDPHIKARRRAEARKMARSMSLAGVPKADVVITNPVHLAVALQYELGMAAPKIVAKGADLLARRVKELAREHGIPIVENKPLARALYPLDLDEDIPEHLYKAVAEVLVSVAKVEDYL